MPGVTDIFSRDYADAYDAIYRHKDYEGEVDLIERILARHGVAGSRHLLDLGCGTGNHALPLARRGHVVVGVDRSAPMVARAHAKAAAALPPLAVTFHESDIRDLDLDRRFDAVLMMFTVLGYQHDDAELMATLGVVRRHLAPGGLFVFDFWNAPAVLAERPRERHLSVTDGSTCITRQTRPVLDTDRHLCRVCFDLQRIDGSGRATQWQEEHVVRYYFLHELEAALRQNRIEPVQFNSFPDGEGPADERAWNVVGVARAK
jgi:SAM-dependent methyltransferase